MNPLHMLSVLTFIIFALSLKKNRIIYLLFRFSRFNGNCDLEKEYFILLARSFAVSFVIYFVLSFFYNEIPNQLSVSIILVFLFLKIAIADLPINRKMK